MVRNSLCWDGKLHSGTSKTNELVPVQPDFPLFCKSHCVTFVPARFILYHVIGSCKGPIISFLNLNLPHPSPAKRDLRTRLHHDFNRRVKRRLVGSMNRKTSCRHGFHFYCETITVTKVNWILRSPELEVRKSTSLYNGLQTHPSSFLRLSTR